MLGFSSLPMLTACYGDFYDESYNDYEDFKENFEQVNGAENEDVPEETQTETE